MGRYGEIWGDHHETQLVPRRQRLEHRSLGLGSRPRRSRPRRRAARRRAAARLVHLVHRLARRTLRPVVVARALPSLRAARAARAAGRAEHRLETLKDATRRLERFQKVLRRFLESAWPQRRDADERAVPAPSAASEMESASCRAEA